MNLVLPHQFFDKKPFVQENAFQKPINFSFGVCWMPRYILTILLNHSISFLCVGGANAMIKALQTKYMGLLIN